MLGYLEWHIDCSLEQLQDLNVSLSIKDCVKVSTRKHSELTYPLFSLSFSPQDELATRFSHVSLPSTSSHQFYPSHQQHQQFNAPPSTYEAAASYPSPPSSPPSSHMSSLSSTPSSTPSSSNSSPSTCETPPQALAGGPSDSVNLKVPSGDYAESVQVAGVDDE